MSKRSGFVCGWILGVTLLSLLASGNTTAQTITISGEVRDAATNNPISGLLVKALEVNFGFKCTTGGGSHYTNPNGQYALICPPGKYKVLFSPTAAYVSQWYNNSPNYSDATVVGTAGGAVPNINALMVSTGGGKISGRVTDPNGNPIQNVMVRVYDEAFNYKNLAFSWDSKDWPYQADWLYIYGDDHVAVAITDGEGSYTISNLAPGKYKVCFYGWISNYLDEWWDKRPGFGQADSITVAGGGTATANAQLIIGGNISGTIRDGGGNPLPNAGVGVYTENRVLVRSAYSQANGVYEVNGLPAGKYKVVFSGPSGTDWAFEWFERQPYFPEAQLITVNAGQNIAGIDAQLQMGWSITGTVNPDLNLARVTAYELRKGEVAYGITNSSGHYQLRGFPDGEYKIKFEKEGYGLQWYNHKQTWEQADPVLVQGGGAAGVNADLPREAQLQANITTPAGVPLPKVKVKVYDPSAEQLILTTVTNSWGDCFLKRIPAEVSGSYGKVYYDSLGTCFLPEWWYDRGNYAAADTVYFQANGISYLIDTLAPGFCIYLPMLLEP